MRVRSDDEIHAEIDKASESEENGGTFSGMSYEQGVKYALEWVVGDMEEKPMDG